MGAKCPHLGRRVATLSAAPIGAAVGSRGVSPRTGLYKVKSPVLYFIAKEKCEGAAKREPLNRTEALRKGVE
ncbi:MAG TPA: hypothetical protein DEQ14_02945 [Treponema sp.]|nr:hypothetical protein [Treponema sp.]